MTNANTQPLGVPYHWYGYEYTDEQARAAFIKRYGYPPANVKRDPARTWEGVKCGPVKEQS